MNTTRLLMLMAISIAMVAIGFALSPLISNTNTQKAITKIQEIGNETDMINTKLDRVISLLTTNDSL